MRAKLKLRLIDLLGITFLASFCSLAWRQSSVIGWIAIIIAITIILYFIKYFRIEPPPKISSMIIIPIVSLIVFCVVFVVGSDYEATDHRFSVLELVMTRFGFAVSIAFWPAFWSPPTLVGCGLIRREFFGKRDR